MGSVSNSSVNQLTTELLDKLGNNNPTNSQLKLAESLLLRSNVNQQIIFHKKLSLRERNCLLLAAKGKSIQETAELLKVKPSTIKTWRKRVIQKLNCTSIAHAIYEGIGYGYIPMNFISELSEYSPFTEKNIQVRRARKGRVL